MKGILKYFIFLIFVSIFLLVLNSHFKIQVFNENPKINQKIDVLKKANFRVNNTYALVFFGRRAQTKILIRYLHKNLKINGGVLDKIVFSVKTEN